MKRLEEILRGLSCDIISGTQDLMITDVVFDSRKVSRGSLFIAVKGVNTDGHKFIGKAIQSGAVAVVAEDFTEPYDSHTTLIKTTDSAYALGIIASEFYGNPSASLLLVGVTGTNGKTTVATLLFKLFTRLGYKCGLISTVENIIGSRSSEATHTTPDPVALNKFIAEALGEGCDYLFMEVSSHALHQKRIAGLKFRGAVFTNLTHDHLDYHKTFDNYLRAKKSFFDSLSPDSFAVINRDDRNGMVMIQNCNAEKRTYSLKTVADFKGQVTENMITGLALRIDGVEIWSRLVGEFNGYNLLAIYGTAVMLGVDKGELLRELSTLTSATGRFEIIRSGSGITAIVDYAHTPDALENVLSTIKQTKDAGARIIVVVGAGGDRDRTKRPIMARVASSLSDKLILTSDNPRSEDPGSIIEEMRSGLDRDREDRTLSINDRRQAIKTAVMLALPGDVLLVAGKGHETYQEIAGVRHHFDDKEELLRIFENLKEK